MKWLFDKIVGGTILLLASPLMLLTAIAIKLDSRGPVFFKQKRYGFNNELIEVYKFRSMYVDQCDATASKLVQKGDPRVTRVGAFIRKTSLDELPQLFNVVFRGNLSLVGTRPHAVHAKAEKRLYDAAVAGYGARPTRTRRSSAAASTTSTTSRTGRCCSTSSSWRRRRWRSPEPKTRIDVD